MAHAAEALSLNRDFDPLTGALVPVAAGIARVTAPNRGPFTFTGTNSFLVGTERLIVIDPGPRDKQHLKALLAAIGGRPVEAILLTHTHRDHAGLARRLKKKTGAPIWFGGRHQWSRPARWHEAMALRGAADWRLLPDRVLKDGDGIGIDGMTLGVLETPGHCANHLSYSVLGTPYLFTGDHVMGWNSTLVAPPDGAMGAYLKSLEKVIVAPYSHYLPAHGGPIAEGRKFARGLLAHREERNREILLGISSGADTVGKLVSRIYQDIGPKLRGAARLTVEAHLEYLMARHEISLRQAGLGARYRR